MDYMDTPEYAIEMLLRIEGMYQAPAPPPPGQDRVPTIS